MFYFQLVIMAGTVLLAYYFEYTDTFPVHVQGFFCFDKAFSKPNPRPEDDSNAPPVLVYSLVTAIPTVTVRVPLSIHKLTLLWGATRVYVNVSVCEIFTWVCLSVNVSSNFLGEI